MIMSPTTVRLQVAELLQQRGMTTQDLADKAGITYNTALSLVRGTSAGVQFDTLAAVCDALGVSPGDILIAESTA